ncbi:hypothetical protein N1851_031423 [Merluccius polli]|uniref:Uncharacterized protein n=1 Tax=Merluccius polli TaxID=89951 RepID=A0AA47M471_MERPO|nr:hypothetical protein N1851_031423 [Merluccius polli]
MCSPSPSPLHNGHTTHLQNYISGAVTRFLRPEPVNPANVDQERTVNRQTAGFGREEINPSQRDEEEEEEEKEKKEEEELEEEPSNLITASLPHSPQPPIALPPRTDTLLLDPGRVREVQCTEVSTRWSDIHSTPQEEETQREQWLIQTDGERTEQGSIKLTAATQSIIERENYKKLLVGRYETSEPDKRQQDNELSIYTDEEHGHHHQEIENTLAGVGPEDEADQNPQVTEEEEEEARVKLSGDEEPDLNEPNNVSGLEMEGNGIVREENITCVNEEHLERTEEGGGGEGGETQKAMSTNPENTDGGSTEPSVRTLSDVQTANHLKSSEGVWGLDLTRIASEEVGEEKADLVMTFSDVLTPFVESPDPNLSSLVSNNDNTVVGQGLLEVVAKQSVEEKEHSKFLIEGTDDFYRKGSDVIDPVGIQEVVGTEEEITKEGACGRVTVYVEETTLVKNQDDDQNDESQLQEEVNQTREEEEEGDGEISVILQTAQDKELNYSKNTEAESEFNGPEHLLCFVDTGTGATGDSLSSFSDDDRGDGEGGVSTHRSVGSNSPGVALMVEAESNNEQEMSAELQDVSLGRFPGSGAGPCRLNCVPCEETRGLIPEVNNGHVAATDKNTEQRALMGRVSEESWVTSQLPHESGGFKYVVSLGEADHSQREDRDTTLKSGERENTAAIPDMVVCRSVEPQSFVDSRPLWGIGEQMSGRAEQATGQEGEAGRTGDGLSDEEHSRHEAHKTDGEHFKTEEPLFEFTLDGERSESTGAASEEPVVSEDGVLSSIWYDNVAVQDDTVLCEEILILPDAAIQKTEACESESTVATMTEENNGRTQSQSENYVEPESIDQPIEYQIKSFEDGQTETEDIVADILDVVMGNDVCNVGSEETTAESGQQRNAGESNRSTVETVGLGSLTDMTSDLLMEVRRDLLDELLESTSRVTLPDELKEMPGQIEGEEDKELPLESYSSESGLAGTLGISNLLEAPMCEDSEHTSGREGSPECEVLTTKPEGIRSSEMLMLPPGVPDVSLHSFTEERPTHSNSPEQELQHHHPPESSGKLSDNEAVSFQAEQDELLYESQMIEETRNKVEAIDIDPEVSAVAKSSAGAADDGRDETSVKPVPISNSVDEDFMKPCAEDPSHLLPDMKRSELSFPSEVDSVILRERKGFGESRQGPCLDSKHPLYKLDINVLDLTVQKSRILVKNPSARPPTDPRALLQMPSLEPSPSHPSGLQRAPPLAGRPIGGLGVGIKLPGFGAGFPALKKTQKVVKEGGESVPEQKSEPQQGMTSMSPKPAVADHKPRFGNPMMSELKSKLKKTSEEDGVLHVPQVPDIPSRKLFCPTTSSYYQLALELKGWLQRASVESILSPQLNAVITPPLTSRTFERDGSETVHTTAAFCQEALKANFSHTAPR